MSRAFYFRFKTINELIDSELKIVPVKNQIMFLAFTIGCHFCYSIGTRGEKTITIKKKYTFTRNGFTEFMVVDENGKHYNINNSLWYWKWNSIEDWTLIRKNNKINIEYYGLRIPMLGMFPNIVYSKKI